MSAPAAVEMIKAHLADLQMPGSLEVVDALMEQLDGGAISAAEALEQLLLARGPCGGNAASSRLCAPHAFPGPRPWTHSTSPSSRPSTGPRS